MNTMPIGLETLIKLRLHQTPRRAEPRLKKDKMYCLLLQGLHCKLRRGEDVS